MTEEQLSALLRLKRYEQPPPQYFDQLLRDIQRRQRSELLHRPLWKIAAERVQTFFSEHSMGQVPYAGAMATVLVVGIAAIGWMTPGREADSTASVQQAPPVAEERLSLSLQASATEPKLAPGSLPVSQTRFAPVVHKPRDGMDARPVSYEPSSSFNF